jgi:3-phenylpropionate/cinnamic acid dioxygenase small subunit
MDARTDPVRPVTDHLLLDRITRFLYEDAAMLDARDYASWWKTLSDDIQYRVTAKVLRDASLGNLEMAVIDETPAQLKQRVEQISTPRLTHAENPPSTTRRFVTNVMARHGSAPGEFQVSSNLLVYRTTANAIEGNVYSGRREDILREAGDEFRLISRIVQLDQEVMFGAISILF